jgi:hypothetical protein
MVVCRYQCQYDPNEMTNVVKDIKQNRNAPPKTLDINGNVIHQRLATRVQWGGSIKKRCKVEFTIKTLYLFKHVSKLCFIQ